MPPDTENGRSYAVAQVYSESYVLRLEKRIAELEEALEQVRKTDYVLNHMYCSCYICKALAGKNTGIELGVY